MPFRVDLHTADINAGIWVGHVRIKIIQHLLTIVEKQALAIVIQRPWPGTIAAVGLNARGLDR